MSEPDADSYALKSAALAEVAAPNTLSFWNALVRVNPK